MDDAEKLRRYERAYVAWMLRIPREVLDRYPYRIVAVNAPGGSMPAWRIMWTRSPPRGVEAQRSSYTTWTDIPGLFDLEDHDAQFARLWRGAESARQ